MVNTHSDPNTNELIAPDEPEVSKHLATRRLNKRQKNFIQYWIDPSSDTFGNTYQSALRAGFSAQTSRVLTANSKNLEWIQEAKEYMDNYSPMHIIGGFQYIAKTATADRDKIQALDRLAKIQGLYIERSQTEVSVTFHNTVPRPTLHIAPLTVIDIDQPS